MTDFARFGTSNMILPPEGPKCFPLVLDFTATDEQVTDLTPLLGEGNALSFIQSFFYDNSQNDNVLFVTSQNVNQRIPLPPRTAGYMPILVASNNAHLTWDTVQAGNLTVAITIMNTPVTACIWEVTT